ncbi:hypothetical protein ACD578_27975 (plasmid) [Microvirga sp. RSM25]
MNTNALLIAVVAATALFVSAFRVQAANERLLVARQWREKR